MRAEPDADGVTLKVESWQARTPARSRWVGSGRIGEEVEAEARAATDDLVTDNVMRIMQLQPGPVAEPWNRSE